MTRSAEPPEVARPRGGATDRFPRLQAERVQEAVLPSGRVVVSCPAPYGVGGLGRHLKELAGALDRRRQPRVCICAPPALPSARVARRFARLLVSPYPRMRTLPPRGRAVQPTDLFACNRQ